jgi:hypothetical protein
MKPKHCVLLSALLIAVAFGAQGGQKTDEHLEFLKIYAEHDRGQPLTPEQQKFLKRVFEEEHPPRDFTGMVPLTDLGKRRYKGYQGGLYPEGENVPPQDHLNAGLKIARQIVPMNAQGQPSQGGKIVFMSIALGNDFKSFCSLAAADTQVNPHLVMVDTWPPTRTNWETVGQRMDAAGVTAAQVEVLWVKTLAGWPWRGFPWEARFFEARLADILRNAQERFPNLKIAYLSSRVYAGYALRPESPEPYCYEQGFAVKWLIADQIAGNPDLNYDPAKGPVRCPWLAWGPYLWADGTKGRKDGLVWLRSDFSSDGMHPSKQGYRKIGKGLLDFLMKDPTSQLWFNDKN